MKKRELVRQLEEMGCIFIRLGKRHDWHQNLRTKVSLFRNHKDVEAGWLTVASDIRQYQKN